MRLAKKVRVAIKPQGVALVLVVLLLSVFWLWPSSSQGPSVPVIEAAPAAPETKSAPGLCEVSACLALTFDDGPDPGLTPRILDTLKQHNAKATFFVLGSHVAGNEALLQRIHQEGHEIGNHSWSHARFTRLTPDQIQQEIMSTQTAIIRAGVPAPHIFRPPYGDVNDAVLAQIPLSAVRWSVDPEDWHPKKQPLLLEHMAAHARPGGIVVMHDTEVTTADHLDALLTQLQAQNYSLVTVSTVLGLSPGQQGVYFARNINR